LAWTVESKDGDRMPTVHEAVGNLDEHALGPSPDNIQ
jgi:hypothetical protein